MEVMEDMPLTSVSRSIQAMATTGYQPSHSWLCCHYSYSQQMLPTLSLQALAEVSAAVAAVSAQPPQLWWDQYYLVVHVQLCAQFGRLKPNSSLQNQTSASAALSNRDRAVSATQPSPRDSAADVSLPPQDASDWTSDGNSDMPDTMTDMGLIADTSATHQAHSSLTAGQAGSNAAYMGPTLSKSCMKSVPSILMSLHRAGATPPVNWRHSCYSMLVTALRSCRWPTLDVVHVLTGIAHIELKCSILSTVETDAQDEVQHPATAAAAACQQCCEILQQRQFHMTAPTLRTLCSGLQAMGPLQSHRSANLSCQQPDSPIQPLVSSKAETAEDNIIDGSSCFALTPSWLEGFAEALVLQLPTLSPSILLLVMQTFKNLNFAPGASWLSAIALVTQSKMSRMRVSQIKQLVDCLTVMQAKMPSIWFGALLKVVAAKCNDVWAAEGQQAVHVGVSVSSQQAQPAEVINAESSFNNLSSVHRPGRRPRQRVTHDADQTAVLVAHILLALPQLALSRVTLRVVAQQSISNTESLQPLMLLLLTQAWTALPKEAQEQLDAAFETMGLLQSWQMTKDSL